MNETFDNTPETTVKPTNEKARTAGPPPFDWPGWTRRLQQALEALLVETFGQKPPPETWDLVQGAIELEAEAAACCE